MKSRFSAGFVAVLTLALAPSLVGCAGGRPDPKWRELTVEAASDNILWEVTVVALEKTGFPLGSGLDRGRLVAVSGWHTSLAPFKGDGYRERCYVEYTPLENRKYHARVRVERERNEDIVRPLDLSYAQWEPDPDDDRRAGMVLGYIQTMLGTDFKVGERVKPGDLTTP